MTTNPTKALIPITPPIVNSEGKLQILFKRIDRRLTTAFITRRVSYRLFLLTFLFFSLLGAIYYAKTAFAAPPLTVYAPFSFEKTVSLEAIWNLRMPIFLSHLFLFLCGFTIYGKPIAALSMAAHGFLIGFSLQYSFDNVAHWSGLILYITAAALAVVGQLLICGESTRFSSFAAAGKTEMFRWRRILSYFSLFLLTLSFDCGASILFLMI